MLTGASPVDQCDACFRTVLHRMSLSRSCRNHDEASDDTRPDPPEGTQGGPTAPAVVLARPSGLSAEGPRPFPWCARAPHVVAEASGATVRGETAYLGSGTHVHRTTMFFAEHLQIVLSVQLSRTTESMDACVPTSPHQRHRRAIRARTGSLEHERSVALFARVWRHQHWLTACPSMPSPAPRCDRRIGTVTRRRRQPRREFYGLMTGNVATQRRGAKRQDKTRGHARRVVRRAGSDAHVVQNRGQCGPRQKPNHGFTARPYANPQVQPRVFQVVPESYRLAHPYMLFSGMPHRD